MGLENGENKKHSTSLIGTRFGKLTVQSIYSNGRRNVCVCFCDCGNTKSVRKDHLTSGKVVSCGCYHSALTGERTKTHGMSRTRLYRIWKGMRNRCSNEHIQNYERYCGRGITVCEEWQRFEPFYEWAMANGYSDDLSIDRIDNDGNYEPSNCQWANRTEQARNRCSNEFITYNGTTKYISDWDKDIGAPKSGRVRARINAGWSIEKAVTTPISIGRNKL